MKNIRNCSLVIIALFLALFSLSAASPKTESNIHYVLLQAYDGLGNYWVEMPGVTYSNVSSPDDLDPVTRHQWRITVNGRGSLGLNGQLIDGYIQTHTVGTGYQFPVPAIYMTTLVHQSDPRFKKAVQYGPTPTGWAYTVYVSGGGGWGDNGNMLKHIQQTVHAVNASLLD